MKKQLLLGAFCIFGMFYSQTQYSGNVGINTTKPEQKLHVNGGFRTDNLIIKENFTLLDKDEDYTFLVKSKENKITSYNTIATEHSTAPLNLIQFKIKTDSSDRDWVNEFDTKINSDKYFVIISSFGFNLPVSGDAGKTPVPQIFAQIKESTKTWILKADYDGFRPNSGDGEWTLNLLVFDRKSSLLVQHNDIDMAGNSTGSASSSIIK